MTLAAALPGLPITYLSLEGNNYKLNSIEAEGAKALASVLPGFSLSHLDLSHNRVEAEGAKALRALKAAMPNLHVNL